MNIKNIDKAIAVMHRAKNFHMGQWQTISYSPGGGRTRCAETEVELHACGNSACFAGYIAISHEFKEDHGLIDSSTGSPCYRDKGGAAAIASWLDIHPGLAIRLVIGELILRPSKSDPRCNEVFSVFYEKAWSEVTPQNVIDKLEAIKTGVIR